MYIPRTQCCGGAWAGTRIHAATIVDLTTSLGSLDPPQAVLPKTKPRTGGNEARISTAVGAPTGAAVPVRLYQAAVRASSAAAALGSCCKALGKATSA